MPARPLAFAGLVEADPLLVGLVIAAVACIAVALVVARLRKRRKG
jgi:predicted PurR-regulated permease PerM